MVRAVGALVLLTVLTSVADDDTTFRRGMYGIGGAHHHKFESNVLEREFLLLVHQPLERLSEDPMPVLYLLDGGLTFPMMAGYYNYLRLQEAVPDMLVVGISYGGMTFAEGNLRGTDYTAPSAERDYYGGASTFQQVLDDEIFPLIETEYPADPSRRVLFGQSLGGQFVVFTALTRPQLFYGYIASNPALHRNVEHFIRLTRSADAAARLVVIIADEDSEQFVEPRNRWLRAWQEDPPFEMTIEQVPRHGHFSVAPEALFRGLRLLMPGPDS
ncbi:MAG: alpha/beta hydrolase-fold protein [Pseudomonadota bacterium]